jgi:sulfate transport system substrate-binding protein
MRSSTRFLAPAALLATAVLAGCGGASDSTDDGGSASASSGGGGVKLNLVAYAVPKVGFDKEIPAFQRTEAGKGVTFGQSYGASGDQSRAVEAGQPADVVNFSLEPDVTRLVESGKVAEDWNQNAEKGIVSSSVVTIVVRKGNPKGIEDWDDLTKAGVEVVTPNVFSSGSAKWNLLAPYAQYSDGGKDKAAGLKYVGDLLKNIKTQPKSGREATQTFLQGKADALLSYENEALNIEGQGEDVEHVTPPQTLRIENPFAVLKTSKHPEQAKAFSDFLFSEEGQRIWGEAGFRPVNPEVAEEFADKYPQPEKLFTVAELGGWSELNDTLFEPDTGDIAKLYEAAGASGS